MSPDHVFQWPPESAVCRDFGAICLADEAAVSCTVKVDPSQHSSYSKRPNQGSFWLDGQLQGLLPCMPSELTLLLRPFVL